MNKRSLTVLVLLGLISLFGLVAFGDSNAPVAPKGIIPTPPESDALQVQIWVDKGAYAVGEPITIHYRVNKQAYVYIWDIEPDGTAHPLFPNTRPGGDQNYVGPGEHVVPGDWKVAPPLGTEYLQILATTTPIDLFSFMTSDPDQFRQQVQAHVLGIVPVEERSWNFTSFEIVSGTPPAYGTLVINSTPSFALVYLDGVYVGYTPRTVHVRQGYHQLLVRKAGYNDWAKGVFVIAGFTRTINVNLTPSAPANQPPTAAFTFSPANPMVGQQVLFNGSSSSDADGSVVSYRWDFGDGTTSGPSGASSVYHAFAAAGTYTVTLTVTDDGGLTDSTSQTVQVGAPNQPPVAAFSFSPAHPMAGDWVQFDGSASFDPDGTITAYSWNFGDGSTASGVSRYHQFTAPGTYTVTLTVTDNGGLTNSTTQTVQVGSPNQPPVAAFSFSPAHPGVGQWVQFDGSASFDPDGSITAYSWNFGDGSTATGVSRYHQFTAPGTYTVTLTVTDDGGLTNSITQTVQVTAPNQAPTAAFNYSPTNPGVGAWVRFDASSSADPDGSITAYSWNFGDGNTSTTGPVVYHQFTAPGTYTVTLTVTDDGGLTNSVSHTVQVGPTNQPPVAAFNYSPPAPNVGEAITLNAAASYDPDGSITAYRWDLDGDGVDDTTGQIISVRYYNPGVHQVRLTVIDNQGLSASTTQGIMVGAGGGVPGPGPAMDGTPGIFVWGSDTWHVTVNAGTGWTSPHAYRLELRTDGSFTNVNRSESGGVAPMGVIPSPSDSGKTLVFDGSLQQGRVDYTFKVSGSKSIYMSLKLDVDGNGTLDESPGFIHLRDLMVNPPTAPFVVGLPQGSSGPLVPSVNFRIGRALQYTSTVRFVIYITDIETLEGI